MNTPLDKSKTLSKAEQKAVVKFHKNEKDKAAIKSANIKRMKEAGSHGIETFETKLCGPPVKILFFSDSFTHFIFALFTAALSFSFLWNLTSAFCSALLSVLD